MPYKDITKNREYNRKWAAEHKKECRENLQNWRKANKEYVRKTQREYLRRNKEKNKEKIRTYHRNHSLHINGKVIYGLNKRRYEGYCELCGRNDTRLVYHHWDDRNPNKGIWVCFLCHQICEAVDKKRLYLAQRYIGFKKALNKKTKNSAMK